MNPPLDTLAVASEIVEYVLDYVERVGTINGPRSHRQLVINSVFVNLTTGVTQSHIAVMVETVAALMAGTATYTKRSLPARANRVTLPRRESR